MSPRRSFCSLTPLRTEMPSRRSFCSLTPLRTEMSSRWSFCSFSPLRTEMSSRWSFCSLTPLRTEMSPRRSFCSLTPFRSPRWSFYSLNSFTSCTLAPNRIEDSAWTRGPSDITWRLTWSSGSPLGSLVNLRTQAFGVRGVKRPSGTISLSWRNSAVF